MTVSQGRFRVALLDAAQGVPDGLLDGAGGPAGNRFSVYRNNVIVSLSDALRTAFPLLHKLLGGQTFDKLAAAYVRQHPPRSPLMMHYGVDMPAFLKDFAPLKHIGYLPDCARLDLALRHAYHAADTQPLDPATFQCPPDALMTLKLSLAPAARMLRSAWPLFDIWRVNHETDAPRPRAVPQDVLITRPEFDPTPHLLPEGVTTWLEALESGQSFGTAHETALAAFPAFDLAQALSVVLQTGALTEYKTKDS